MAQLAPPVELDKCRGNLCCRRLHRDHLAARRDAQRVERRLVSGLRDGDDRDIAAALDRHCALTAGDLFREEGGCARCEARARQVGVAEPELLRKLPCRFPGFPCHPLSPGSARRRGHRLAEGDGTQTRRLPTIAPSHGRSASEVPTPAYLPFGSDEIPTSTRTHGACGATVPPRWAPARRCSY